MSAALGVCASAPLLPLTRFLLPLLRCLASWHGSLSNCQRYVTLLASLVWCRVSPFLPCFALQWTSWVLLVALALYDLCAVLTPCGPLKALVKLAQARPEQPIPGLLYEAEVSESGDAGALRRLL